MRLTGSVLLVRAAYEAPFVVDQVAVGQTFGNLVQVTKSLRESNVSLCAALTRCRDNEAVNE
jgi:hypothetical protein